MSVVQTPAIGLIDDKALEDPPSYEIFRHSRPLSVYSKLAGIYSYRLTSFPVSLQGERARKRRALERPQTSTSQNLLPSLSSFISRRKTSLLYWICSCRLYVMPTSSVCKVLQMMSDDSRRLVLWIDLNRKTTPRPSWVVMDKDRSRSSFGSCFPISIKPSPPFVWKLKYANRAIEVVFHPLAPQDAVSIQFDT
jgi:hypothetical protein